ncbi:MAG: hypothetical protein ABI678_09595 [Kofleriaceae bacterium]
MRSSFAVVLGVLGLASVASAEPESPSLWRSSAPSGGVWVDAGVGMARIDPGNDSTYRGEYVRFAPQMSFHRNFYLGAELDVGKIDQVIALNPNACRTSGGGTCPTGGGSLITSPMDPHADGSIAAAKALFGLRGLAGPISAGAELAAGIRHASLKSATGYDVLVSEDSPTFEVHGHVDVWLTPKLTVGAMVGADLANTNNLSAGLEVGFHLVNYDRMRARY